MEMINSAFTSRERGRSPARFDLAAEDGAGDGTVEGNPEGNPRAATTTTTTRPSWSSCRTAGAAMTSGGAVPVTALIHIFRPTLCMLTVPVTVLLVSSGIRRRMRFRSRLSLLDRRSRSGVLPLQRALLPPVVRMTKRRLNGLSRMGSVPGSLSSLLRTLGGPVSGLST
eukprot:8549483-Heterocapsa_arctica.AAC.1